MTNPLQPRGPASGGPARDTIPVIRQVMPRVARGLTDLPLAQASEPAAVPAAGDSNAPVTP